MSSLSSGALAYRGVSFLFGDGTPYPLTGFARGVASFRADDRDIPRGDGRMFGRDVKSGPTHELSLLVQGEGLTRAERELDAKSRVGMIAGAWSADSLRRVGGGMAELRIGERITFGRPREFTPDDSGLWDGVSNPRLEFVAANDLWYGTEELTRIRFVPSVGAGLRFPANAPFRFGGAPTVRNGSVAVTGDVATWPVFEIRGPVVDPAIEVVGVGRLMFNVALPYDQRLVVDTRPWARWVQRGRTTTDELTPFPGALSPSGARLSDMSLLPGAYQVLLRGTDPTGTAELQASVWPAFTSF